jgi:hypothetical protein
MSCCVAHRLRTTTTARREKWRYICAHCQLHDPAALIQLTEPILPGPESVFERVEGRSLLLLTSELLY